MYFESSSMGGARSIFFVFVFLILLFFLTATTPFAGPDVLLDYGRLPAGVAPMLETADVLPVI